MPRHTPAANLPPQERLNDFGRPEPERTDYGKAETLERETAVSEAPLDKVRFILAGGQPTHNQIQHAQGSALFVEGEMLNLVWVNQEDIRRLGVRFDMPENCPECGRPNERPDRVT